MSSSTMCASGPEAVIPAYLGGERPSSNGSVSQIIQAAVDAGIARGAIEETIRFVRGSRRGPGSTAARSTATTTSSPSRRSAISKSSCMPPKRLLEQAGRAIDGILDNPTRGSRRRNRRQGRRGQGPHDRDRHSRRQQAARARRRALDARPIQSRPALAQRPHPYAARPGALEIFPRRQSCAQRRRAAAPRLELTLSP